MMAIRLEELNSLNIDVYIGIWWKKKAPKRGGSGLSN